ncbi:hypothetical protein DLAC_11653 [Tieghemostelium lacteum]|uniref:Mannosyltransferase n=1 Tax=Tieghemostelium lacteum TaxID=361077 RepID=A0A151ZEU3_TIELA|nr:hypothetical protein DLAC_11653 [Tieghemostelium lacteum]|eukprot:KYQ92481.1 hypothetical protein DLAC_11653 [Tieghemostelium lacteum]
MKNKKQINNTSNSNKTSKYYFNIENIGILSILKYQVPRSYFIFLIFRFLIGLCSTGYIHPDEYFQSPEITSQSIFQYRTFTAWEFDPKNPCRSIVIPMINSGIPFFILKQIQNLVELVLPMKGFSVINGTTMLVAPRLFMILTSLLMDYYVLLICKRFRIRFHKPLLLLSSSWLIIIFQSRTFSNSIESLLVATLLTVVIVYDYNSKSSNYLYDYLIGSILAFGIFSRFTFIFFSIPIGIYLLWQLVQHYDVLTIIPKALNIIISFFLTSMAFIILDSMYFGYLDSTKLLTIIMNYDINLPGTLDLLKNNITITPVNSFIYNMNPENLAQHGIHNRLTHLFVNLPMMIGPLIILIVMELVNIIKNIKNNNNNNNQNNINQHQSNQNVNSNIENSGLPKSIKILLLGVIIVGIFFLSLAPHQEARFLLPLFFPTIILTSRYMSFSKVSTKLLILQWLLFNIAMVIFFGFLHQGGVAQSLAYLNKRVHQPPPSPDTTQFPKFPGQRTHIIYHHTYMPPRHLLGLDKVNDTSIRVFDITGDNESLQSALNGIHHSEIFLLSPDISILYNQYRYKVCQLLVSFWPHLSTEHPPLETNSYKDFQLYLFKCVDHYPGSIIP